METVQVNSQTNKGLNIGLWVAQVLLAALFLMSGTMKLVTPIEEIVKNAPWAADYPWLVRFIGISELAGSIGLILPSLLRIKPSLTPLAALGLLVIMILAAGLHAVEGEYSHAIPCIVIALIAAFIAWGRSKKAPIAAK